MSDRPLVVGLPGLPGLSTITPQQLTDAIEKAKPGSQFSFIYRGTVTPDVATYPYLALMLWIDNGVPKIYNSVTTAWDPMTFGDVSNTNQLANGVVTPAKISNSGASAFYILRTDNSNAVEWAALSEILSNDTVPLNALVNTGAPSNSVLQSIDGVTSWQDFTIIASSIVASIASYDIQKLTGRVANAILSTNGDSDASWVPITDILTTSIADNSIPIAKLVNNTATVRQVLTKESGGPAWSDPFPFSKASIVQSGTALPGTGANAKITVNHGLGLMPKLVRAVLVCTDAGGDGANFVFNDEINIESLGDGAAAAATIRVKAGSPPQEIEVHFATSGANFYRVPVAGGTQTIVATTKWALKVYSYA